jgi:hypothetical protein
MTSGLELELSLWRWATEEGQPQQGTEQELVRQLATGQVPPYALVWRAGWGEWLPAMQVPELAVAFPVRGAAPRTARPSTIPGVPPVPVSEYPRLRLLAKQTPLGLLTESDCREREVITSEVPAAALLEAARVMTEPSPPRDLGLDLAVARASMRPEEFTPYLTPSGQRSIPPSSRSALPLAAEFGLSELLDVPGQRPHSWAFWLRAHGLWLAALAVALGLAALFGARRFAASAPRAAAPASVASSGIGPASARSVAPPAAPPAPPVPACRFRKQPVKLDDWAVVDVRPGLRVLPEAGRMALGYAQSHRHATGGVIDLDTLAFDRRFGQQQERQIFSVTPLAANGSVSYHVERMGALVAFGRALDTAPPLRVGMNDDGLVLGPLDQRSEKLWELPFGTMISVPEVVVHPDGFTLATRAGRSGGGQLRLGLLSATGAPRSALEQLGAGESDYGRPALASGPEQTVLAVARRTDPESGHSLLLARARNGELPLELQALEILGPGDVEVSATALTALADGGFVLLWSEGAGWRRQVKLQRLSSTLVPVGTAFEISTPDPALGGATAGAIQWVGDQLMVLYFLRRGEGNSLWASSVECGA